MTGPRLPKKPTNYKPTITVRVDEDIRPLVGELARDLGITRRRVVEDAIRYYAKEVQTLHRPKDPEAEEVKRKVRDVLGVHRAIKCSQCGEQTEDFIVSSVGPWCPVCCELAKKGEIC